MKAAKLVQISSAVALLIAIPLCFAGGKIPAAVALVAVVGFTVGRFME